MNSSLSWLHIPPLPHAGSSLGLHKSSGWDSLHRRVSSAPVVCEVAGKMHDFGHVLAVLQPTRAFVAISHLCSIVDIANSLS